MNNNQQEQQQNMQTGSGLTRYRSAPSSYLTSLLNSPTSDGGFGAEDFAQLFNPRASSPETQRIFSRFMNSSGADTVQEDCSSHMTPPPHSQYNSQYLQIPKSEPDQVRPPHGGQRNEYSSSASQMMYHSHNSEENKAWGSYNSNRVGHIKMEGGGGVNSGLIRHSSSPAGLFANINIEPEFGAMRGIGNFGGGNNANAEATFSSASRFNSQMDFSSKHYSSSGMMHPIPEIESKDIGGSSRADQQLEEDRANEGNYISEFMNSWDDSSLLSENFLGELADNKSEQFSNANPSVDQENKTGHRPTTMLSHHLSLPRTSAELSVEKLWQDTVPCKIRAKRGCATHPRSIAERVRRTKISERIRKLQELVPNMEKQTNTSDMLDLAIDYIKDLQRQVKTLSDNREKCTCSAKQGS